MVQALQTLWKQASPRQPQRVQSDDGTEFMNAKVQAFFKQHQVDNFSTQGDTKAALAEVLIKTLKTKLYRYFTASPHRGAIQSHRSFQYSRKTCPCDPRQ